MELKLQRVTFILFVFITCPVAKAAGGARDGNAN